MAPLSTPRQSIRQFSLGSIPSHLQFIPRHQVVLVVKLAVSSIHRPKSSHPCRQIIRFCTKPSPNPIRNFCRLIKIPTIIYRPKATLQLKTLILTGYILVN